MKFWTKDEHRSIIFYILSKSFHTQVSFEVFYLGHTIFKCFAYPCANY